MERRRGARHVWTPQDVELLKSLMIVQSRSWEEIYALMDNGFGPWAIYSKASRLDLLARFPRTLINKKIKFAAPALPRTVAQVDAAAIVDLAVRGFSKNQVAAKLRVAYAAVEKAWPPKATSS